MSADQPSVALLCPRYGSAVRDAAASLPAQGFQPRVITSHSGLYQRSADDGFPVTRHWRPPEPWTARNIESGLSHLPFTFASLTVDPPDLAHAFHPADALAALQWSRHAARPVVLSCLHGVTREGIAAKRLRKAILERAICETAIVTVTSAGARDALWRWFGVEAEIVEAGGSPAEGYAAIYRRLLGR